MSNHTPSPKVLSSALRTIAIEKAGLAALEVALSGRLGQALIAAAARIRAARGKVIVTGMGKSGHVGRKIAATLASTGTPAFFVHPGEASHGDLGMVGADDVVLALSWSGETAELRDLVDFSRRFGIGLVALTSDQDSALGRAADVVLELPRAEEACPNGLAPTTSTVMQLALGDALAVALLEDRGFTAQDFRVYHPGGRLGAMLVTVDDLMHTGDALPLAPETATLGAVIDEMSAKGLGCCGLIDTGGQLVGVVTDGDLRRAMGRADRSTPASAIMTRNPKVSTGGRLASEILDTMNSRKITVVFVVDGGRPVGLVHVHDLLKAGVA